MKTAVEWIEGYLKKFNHIQESLSLRKAFEQAKEMHKKEMENSYNQGLQSNFQDFEQYYNETFKSE
jgi:hypothetical protein